MAVSPRTKSRTNAGGNADTDTAARLAGVAQTAADRQKKKKKKKRRLSPSYTMTQAMSHQSSDTTPSLPRDEAAHGPHAGGRRTTTAVGHQKKTLTHSKNQRVQFVAEGQHEIHLVERLATPYNKRFLWHQPLDLQRSRIREIQRNLSCPEWVDHKTTEVKGHYDSMELTWRGLEDCRPPRPSSPAATKSLLHGDHPIIEEKEDSNGLFLPGHQRDITRFTHVRMIVQEYRALVRQQQHHNNKPGSWTGDDLPRAIGYLSEALSRDDRQTAYQRGLADQAAARWTASLSDREHTGTSATRSISSSERRATHWLSLISNERLGFDAYRHPGNNRQTNTVVLAWVVGGYLLWILRTMMVGMTHSVAVLGRSIWHGYLPGTAATV